MKYTTAKRNQAEEAGLAAELALEDALTVALKAQKGYTGDDREELRARAFSVDLAVGHLAGAREVITALDAVGWSCPSGLMGICTRVRDRLWREVTRSRSMLSQFRATGADPSVVDVAVVEVTACTYRAEGASLFTQSLLVGTAVAPPEVRR